MSEKLVKGVTPLVSIVIPVYNTEAFLENTVESVLNQTYSDKQIILVDDGSPDNSPALCDALAEKYDCVTVIHKENGGLSSARNAGVEKATGKYILFLDSDDTLEVHAIEDMVKIAEEKNSDAVIPNSYYKVYENGTPNEVAYHFTEDMFKENAQDYALEILIGKARGQRSTAVLYKLETIQNNKIEFPLGTISEDFFFNADFMAVAENVSLYTKPSLFNLKHTGTISTTFQKNIIETVWLMDEKANEFIQKVGRTDKNAQKKVDSLLCRNLVVYLFTVMAPSNKLSDKEKHELVRSVLNNPKSRGVWKKGHEVPFFESKKTTLAFKIVYCLLRLRLVGLALKVMTLR